MDGLVSVFKRLVGAKNQPAGIVDQCVARNAGALVVGAAEAAIDDDEPPAALDGAFAFNSADRHMAVDDMAALAFQAKFAQNMFGGARVGNVLVVGVLYLNVGGGVGNVQPFKRRHGAAAKQRRFCPAPQIPQKVLPSQPRRAALRRTVTLAGAAVAVVEQRLAAAGNALKGDGRKRAVFGHGHSAVVEQIAVAHFIKCAVSVQKLHMALQPLAFGKAAHQPGNDLALVGGQHGGVRRIHGGEVAVQQGIGRAKIIHCARVKVDVI